MDVQLLVLAQTAHQRPWSTSHTELIVLRLCVSFLGLISWPSVKMRRPLAQAQASFLGLSTPG